MMPPAPPQLPMTRADLDVILSTVGERTYVSNEDILSRKRDVPLPYSRKLTIYFIRNMFPNTNVHRIKNMFGFQRRELVSIYYREIKEAQSLRVKKDVQFIQKTLTTRIAV